MTKYKVLLQITDEFFVEAQNEEEARRIIAEHYSNDSLNTVEQGDSEVYIFSEEVDEDDDVGTAEELSTPPTSV